MHSSISLGTAGQKEKYSASNVYCQSKDPNFFALVGPKQDVVIKGKQQQMAGPGLESAEVVERGPDTRVFVTAEELAKEFSEDLQKARNKYVEKVLIVTGKVTAIKTLEGFKLKYAELKGDGNLVIKCVFEKPDTVQKLKVGDTVKVYGPNWRKEEGSILVDSCETLPLK
jgi:hypothetical protein